LTAIPDPNEAAPIGEFVRMHLPQILDCCQHDPAELANLQDKDYCRASFRQSYPFLAPSASAPGSPARYWSAKRSAPFDSAGYRVTSQWYPDRHTAHFVNYLREKDIEPIGVSDGFIAWAEDTVAAFGSTGSAPGGPRYRSYAIGIAQNAFVRYILSNVAHEAFNEEDWAAAVASDFDGVCAYCGAVGKVTIDHAVPINRVHLGEHRLGNMVPACASCNGGKSNRSYRDFLLRGQVVTADGLHRLEAIERHMANHSYRPIEDHDGVGPLIEEARAKIKQIGDELIDAVNRQLAPRLPADDG
jgi:hypothetical protein